MMDRILPIGLSNEQIYQLIKESHGLLPLLLHPDQLKYAEKRLEEEGVGYEDSKVF